MGYAVPVLLLVVVVWLGAQAMPGRARAGDRGRAPATTSSPSGATVVGGATETGGQTRAGWFLNPPTAETATSLRAVLRARLAALKRSERPTALQPGAMCYKPMYIQGVIDVVCTGCGARASVKKTWQTMDIDRVERLVKAIAALEDAPILEFDTRSFCPTCQTGLEPAGVAVLVGLRRRGDATPGPEGEPPGAAATLRRVVVTSGELRAVKAFLEGNERIPDEVGVETRATVDAAADIARIIGLADGDRDGD